jgi:hypothetical protein
VSQRHYGSIWSIWLSRWLTASPPNSDACEGKMFSDNAQEPTAALWLRTVFSSHRHIHYVMNTSKLGNARETRWQGNREDYITRSFVISTSHHVIPVGARFSLPVQTGPGAHPTSCTMGTGSYPGVKRPGRGADHPSPSSAEVKERVELYLYSPCGHLWPVVGWALPLPFYSSPNTVFFDR